MRLVRLTVEGRALCAILLWKTVSLETKEQDVAMLYPIATLEDDKLKAVRELEDEIGSPVVALSAVEASSAKLSEDKLAKLQALEDELDVVLVAVKPD